MRIRLDDADFMKMVELWVDDHFYSKVFVNEAHISENDDGDQSIEVEVLRVEPEEKT